MYNKQRFLEFLSEMDKLLPTHIEIIAIGGTAIGLLGIREQTMDVDFFYKNISFDEMEKIVDKLKNKFKGKIDYWEDGKMLLTKHGRIIEQSLPSNYSKLANIVEEEYKNITLKVLNPVDIIITKIGRCNERDIEDIVAVQNKYHFSKEKLQKRFNLYLKKYTGNKNEYRANFKYVCEHLFTKE